MSSETPKAIVIEFTGEGKTDLAVVPVLTRRICGDTPHMVVKTKRYPHLQSRLARWRKVHFAKKMASNNGSDGCVFVIDSEGDKESVQKELVKGRDSIYPSYPMAIGVAHPCIEAWLLADASAIRRGMNLVQRPTVPSRPEELPAPQHDAKNNPKVALASCDPKNRHPNTDEKSSIANYLDLASAEVTCPSFGSFAAEVRNHIGKLFPRIEPIATPPDSNDPPSTDAEVE